MSGWADRNYQPLILVTGETRQAAALTTARPDTIVHSVMRVSIYRLQD
jgi:hypothetical protein